MHVATRSTQWEDPRLQVQKQQQQKQVTTGNTPYSRDYKVKYENLRRHFQSTKPVSSSVVVVVVVVVAVVIIVAAVVATAVIAAAVVFV